MKRKTFLNVLFFALFVMFSALVTACGDTDCYIDKAEFRSANKIRVYISNWPDAESNLDFSVEVYINGTIDNSYYVKSHSYAAWDFYADITLNKDVLVGGIVIVKPSYASHGLSGSVSVTREE